MSPARDGLSLIDGLLPKRPQDRRALLLGALALVAMLGYARVLRPAAAELAAQRQALLDERANFARERALVTSVARQPHLRDSVAARLRAEAPRLFAGDSVAAMAELTAYVTTLADATQSRLTSLEAHAPHTAQGVTTLAVDVRGEGSWRAALAFVHSLESATRLVDVQSVRFERGPRGGPLGGDQISFSATVAGYSRSAP